MTVLELQWLSGARTPSLWGIKTSAEAASQLGQEVLRALKGALFRGPGCKAWINVRDRKISLALEYINPPFLDERPSSKS